MAGELIPGIGNRNWIGKHANDAAALAYIQLQKWDSSQNGAGTAVEGMLYYDTTIKEVKTYTGTAWVTSTYSLSFLDGTDVPPINLDGMNIEIQSVPFSIDGESTVERTYPIQTLPYYTHQSKIRTPMTFDLENGEFEGEDMTEVFNAPWVDSTHSPSSWPADAGMKHIDIIQRNETTGTTQYKAGAQVSTSIVCDYYQVGWGDLDWTLLGDSQGTGPLLAAANLFPSFINDFVCRNSVAGCTAKIVAQIWLLEPGGTLSPAPTLIAETGEMTCTTITDADISADEPFVEAYPGAYIPAGREYMYVAKYVSRTGTAANVNFGQKGSTPPAIGTLTGTKMSEVVSGTWGWLNTNYIFGNVRFTLAPVRPSADPGYTPVVNVGTGTYPVIETSDTLVIRPWDEVRDDTITSAPGATEVPVASLPKELVSNVRADLDTHMDEASLETTITDDDTKYPSSGAVADFVNPSVVTSGTVAGSADIPLSKMFGVYRYASTGGAVTGVGFSDGISGQRFWLEGTSDTDTVRIDHGGDVVCLKGVDLLLKDGDMSQWMFDGTNYIELQRYVSNSVFVKAYLSLRAYVGNNGGYREDCLSAPIVAPELEDIGGHYTIQSDKGAQNFTVDYTTNDEYWTLIGNTLEVGDFVLLSSSGTLPATANTNEDTASLTTNGIYIVWYSDGTNVKLKRTNRGASPRNVVLTGNGTGTHTLTHLPMHKTTLDHPGIYKLVGEFTHLFTTNASSLPVMVYVGPDSGGIEGADAVTRGGGSTSNGTTSWQTGTVGIEVFADAGDSIWFTAFNVSTFSAPNANFTFSAGWQGITSFIGVSQIL